MTLHLEPAPPMLYRVAFGPNPLEWRSPRAPLDQLEAIVRKGNRWDAPDGAWDTLYLADAALVAFVETIQSFRPQTGQAARILAATAEDEPDSDEPPPIDGGLLPRSFFEPDPPQPNTRMLGIARIRTECPPFVDVSHPDTHHELTLALGVQLAQLDVAGVDRGVVMNQDRRITRLIAGYLYARHRREAVGIRYESRFVPDGWCYAAWDNMRPFLELDGREPVTRERPELLEATSLLGITPV